MLTFICPHCQKELQIKPAYLGQRGKCNKCGGRIALIGRMDTPRAQVASKVVDAPEGKAPPPTPKQVAAVKNLGAAPEQIASLDRENTGNILQQLKRVQAEREAPTDRQLEYLKQLGVPEPELAAVKSKGQASRMIDQWLPPPSDSQREYLARLGATGEQIAALRTKSDAAELIQRFLAGA